MSLIVHLFVVSRLSPDLHGTGTGGARTPYFVPGHTERGVAAAPELPSESGLHQRDDGLHCGD